jgi:hypothetical protein
MRRCGVFLVQTLAKTLVSLLVCFVAMWSLTMGEGFAAKKPVKTSPPKPIYEAPMTVVIVRGVSQTCEPLCPEWIAAEGEITSATPAAFQRAFKAMGKKRLPIVIRSPGGSINAALDIGRMIRKRGLDVAVGATLFQGCAPSDKGCKSQPGRYGVLRGAAMDYGGFCYSACPLILASGKERLAAYGTQVGVHQPKTIWTQQRYTYRETYRIINGKKKILSRKIINRSNAGTKVTYGYDKSLRKRLTVFFRDMGVDTAILADSEKASFKNMNQLTGLRVQELRLRTKSESVGIYTAPAVCTRSDAPSNCIKGEGKYIEPTALVAPKLNGSVPIGIVPGDPNMALTVVRNANAACEPFCPAWIAAEGVIIGKTPNEMRSLLSKLGDTKLPVVLDSPGGNIDAAIELAALIRTQHLSVVIGHTRITQAAPHSGLANGILQSGRCNGACVAAFVGGERRANAFESQVLVHAPVNDDEPGQQSTAVKLYSHFTKMGIGKGLLDSMREASGTAQIAIYEGQQNIRNIVNVDNFKDIVPTPARCTAIGGSNSCFKVVSGKLSSF